VPVVQRKVTFAVPVAGPAADGSITPALVAMVRAVGPAVWNLQTPVTVAETERVWVALAASTGAESIAPLAARARRISLVFMGSFPFKAVVLELPALLRCHSLLRFEALSGVCAAKPPDNMNSRTNINQFK
jgi:hypothetical protein